MRRRNGAAQLAPRSIKDDSGTHVVEFYIAGYVNQMDEDQLARASTEAAGRRDAPESLARTRPKLALRDRAE
jgi:hypothetical protein